MKSVSVLFVCLGNICRSPAAEGIFQYKVETAGLESWIKVDSAGTAAYHAGEKADKRMIRNAAERGYDLTSIARKFDPQRDFDKHDYIVAMDRNNFNDLQAMDPFGKYRDRIYLMTNFCSMVECSEVPDPYYGGSEGFQLVITILEDACSGLLERIINDTGINKK
jgi:protein-tyrosine phosphatase